MSRRRQEIVVGAGLVAVTVYGFIVLPLRPWLLGVAPDLLAVVTGSRPALIAVGALAAAEGRPWLWPLLASIVSIVKFHWVFWWAGRLWGEKALVRVAGSGRRSRRRIDQAQALVRRYQVLAVAVTYVPLPVARELVFVAIGTAGVPFRRFLAVDLTIAALTQTTFFLLGVWLGESAVAVVREYALYAGWIALAVLAVMTIAGVRALCERRERRVSTRPSP
ncbi:MAG: VTT domain-containing protein [Mobilicoccus sp.]|nr:VTT domain-containing protein [Mobilicoccus sp.]